MNVIRGSELERNNTEELIQKAAWRLVRSADDRMGGVGRGAEKLMWAVGKLQKEFNFLLLKCGEPEDYIRAAFIQFRTETKAVS